MEDDPKIQAAELIVRYLNYTDAQIIGAFLSGWVSSMAAGLYYGFKRVVEDAD